jgi:hypothetical protein
MIDYNLIASSVTFYEKLGLKRVETPWYVSKAVSDITKPATVPDSFILNHNDKVLVASGEQSFLYLYLKGYLPKGAFQTVTPCFRYESHDETHTKTFIKNELIDTLNADKNALDRLTSAAHDFFISIGFSRSYLEITETREGYDIEYNGVELGSYGIRECSFLKWVYGTGCSEPRTSFLLRKHGLS